MDAVRLRPRQGDDARNEEGGIERRAELAEVDAVAEVGGSWGEDVTAGERRPGRLQVVGSLSSSTARVAPPARATAGASSPLSGPTSTPAPSPTSTAMALRLVPTPGSTTPRTTPSAT